MIELMRLKLIVVDIDGTMTDGSIYYDNMGNEIKKFNTRDAAGFFCLKAAEIQTVVMTGRESSATLRRANELGIDCVYQNIGNKNGFLDKLIKDRCITYDEIGYIGDDLNDYSAMKSCGFRACPKDACEEIKSIADYVSRVVGGNGVVRDVAEYIFRKRNQWDELIGEVYGCEITR